MKFNYWPKSFKYAKVIPILKSGKPPSDVKSYRPISLLNAIGNILEKVIYHLLECISWNALKLIAYCLILNSASVEDTQQFTKHGHQKMVNWNGAA